MPTFSRLTHSVNMHTNSHTFVHIQTHKDSVMLRHQVGVVSEGFHQYADGFLTTVDIAGRKDKEVLKGFCYDQ